jgi:hypothetical protein
MLETIISFLESLSGIDPMTAITLTAITALGVVGYSVHIIGITVRNKKDG